ncbi:MAG: pro-sigmaK processing inhibitor BofA family protein [Hydrogenoanaerobacterium sp.]
MLPFCGGEFTISLRYLPLTGAVFLVLLMLFLFGCTGKPLRAFLGTAVPGLLSLAAVNYAAFFTGVALTVNATTLFAATFFGLPGVISVFILKIMWGI